MRETLVTLFYARRPPLSLQSAASSGITLFEVRACFYPIFIPFFFFFLSYSSSSILYPSLACCP